MQFERIHSASEGDVPNALAIGKQFLDALILHFARPPRFQIGGTDPQGLARIVARARAFIHENLDQPLSIEMITSAAATSERTLQRAFHVVLDETPRSYVRKLRLHRIRHELVSDAEAISTITHVALHWNVPELGRFAAWYRDLFGDCSRRR